MRTLILLPVLSIYFAASFAMANSKTNIYDSEFSAVVYTDAQNNRVVEPLSRNCDEQPQPASVGALRDCNPDNEECPAGTYPTAKYCWGGWGRGWSLCGHACKGNPNGGKGKDGPGGRGGNGCGGKGHR